MRLGIHIPNSNLLRVAAVAAIAVSASACSSLPSVPDWVDPTTWFGSDESADNGQTPDLASVPDKPAATKPDDQQKVAESLAADRSHAEYSAETLRGGTEAAAAPPPNVAAAPVSEELAATTTATSKHAAPKPASAAVSEPVQNVDRSVTPQPAGQAMAGTLPAAPAGTQVASVAPPPETTTPSTSAPVPAEATSVPVPAEATPAEPAPAPAAVAPPPQAVAAVSPPPVPPPGAQAAVPPTPTAPIQMASISPSDAALGFKPSTAPPLAANISQFVAAPIIQHYEQTAAAAGIAYAPPAQVASASKPRLHRPVGNRGEGGPERMTGAVVANLEVLNSPGAAAPADLPSVYANPQGLPPAAVVFFPGDSVFLNAEGRAEVRQVVERYKATGGQGFIRVVGHSSSRTANMPVKEHMAIIFRKSQQRADAVAQEIIHEGVPADKVLVEAVGDSQPVYYESMPKGEEGNRRAEIFLQG